MDLGEQGKEIKQRKYKIKIFVFLKVFFFLLRYEHLTVQLMKRFHLN